MIKNFEINEEGLKCTPRIIIFIVLGCFTLLSGIFFVVSIIAALINFAKI